MKRWIYALIPVLVLASLIAWRVGAKKAETAAQTGMRAMRMKAPALATLASAQVRELTHTFDATGSVEAPLNVDIAPKVTGRILMLEVREGDRVRKGQVLVRIDPSEVEAQVHQAMATLAEEEYRLAQARISQNPTNVSVNTLVRQQKAALASAKADANQVAQNYEALLAAAAASVTDTQAKIDNAKAALNSAQANLDNANSKYKRYVKLLEKGFIAAQDVDDAKAAVTSHEAAVEIARGQLSSAAALKSAAEQQAKITKTKGKADIEAAKAKVAQAEASLDYANANTAQTSAYKQSISALQSSVAAARAALASTQARRADTVLKSPLDGFVTRRYADPGAVATPGQPILGVQFMHQVWVTVSVPEDVCTKIDMNQPSTVKFDSIPGRTFTGSVIQINPAADPQSRQYTVRIIIDNSKSEFKPGMFGRVSLVTDRVPDALVVPREAIQRDKLGTCVMLVDRSGKAQRRSVVTGDSDSGFVAIEQGLSPGEKVVTMSSFPVKEGQMVQTGGRRGPGKPGGKFGKGGRN